MVQQSEPNSHLPMSVTRSTDGIIVQIPETTESPQNWRAKSIDTNRILLFSGDADVGLSAAAGFASYPVEVFKDFLLSLVRSHWSGLIAIDTGVGIKKIFLNQGVVTFAASTLIDDRMGEVIYREATISIDELTSAAAQVSKQRKFGQVLLGSGVFSNRQLWEALKLQIIQILRSCFMSERVYFEINPGGGQAPTEVVFTESTEDLITSCFSFGCAFRAFLSRLRTETEIVVLVPSVQLPRQYQPGTFFGDLLGMLISKPRLQDLLNLSKLTDHYTIVALLNLYHFGIIALKPEVEVDKRLLPSHGPMIQPVKTRIDLYSHVLHMVRKSFLEAQNEFPIQDLSKFAQSFNERDVPSFLLDQEGALSKASIAGILAQCTGNAARVSYFAVRIDSLIQFLLQVAGDNLDFQTAKKIRQEYRAIAS